MTIDSLVEKIQTYNPDCNEALIRKAYAYADQAHSGQVRNSGEPYITHPLHVAYILAELKMDDPTICGGLLHDVLEDTEISYEQMEDDFGSEITTLVDGVTKLKKIASRSKIDNQVDNYRKMVMAMANDIRVVIIKLADRLHNLRTLDYKERPKQIEKAKETIEIYVPIAHRLGIFAIKSELEDLCLKYLDPQAYYEIAELVDKKLEDRKEEIERIEDMLSQKLDELGMTYEITGRPKTLYSIYKKMYKQDKSFNEIFDITAIRVIVDTVSDCYSVLGVVHTLWKPIPKRFKDYIAMPKQNMYQSLHTTVIGQDGQVFEVQIRTWEMHRTAEFGIAAHWQYKEGAKKKSEFDEKLTWVRQLMEWQKTTTDSQEFLETLKGDFFSDEVYVFSPRGDVIELPRGSTPIDFAYRIHSDVGNACVGAKIDGKLLPLDTQLENGNIVEVITSKNSAGPSRDWLDIVQSSGARSKIRQFFKRANRDEHIENGRDMIIQEVKKDGYPTKKVITPEALEKLVDRMSYSSPDDLLAAVGFGTQSLAAIVSRLEDIYDKAQKRKELEAMAEGALAQADREKAHTSDHEGQEKSNSVSVVGEGTDNLEVKFAQCCSPVPGDDIVGYITRGHGITVHRKSCPNIRSNQSPERLIELEWNKINQTTFDASLTIEAMNVSGYVADLAQLIVQMDMEMNGIEARSREDSTVIIKLTVRVEDKDRMEVLIRKIREMEPTLAVYRVRH
ncbi:RelA/SpoT family protein [Kallipyga massiliensis]|uniref:RelA/SpoT family protein n=1 Tax=Kallipyga massiliensis TaxID=1472764 RepID=UPI0004AE2A1E|nr:bifunctional (p)ppGpp synthetase/guanosine-3',5'-bis(diphosphate) 3'-pyrophosphohydrolase [Kallipyga massiliensis]